MVSLAQFISVM